MSCFDYFFCAATNADEAPLLPFAAIPPPRKQWAMDGKTQFINMLQNVELLGTQMATMNSTAASKGGTIVISKSPANAKPGDTITISRNVPSGANQTPGQTITISKNIADNDNKVKQTPANQIAGQTITISKKAESIINEQKIAPDSISSPNGNLNSGSNTIVISSPRFSSSKSLKSADSASGSMDPPTDDKSDELSKGGPKEDICERSISKDNLADSWDLANPVRSGAASRVDVDENVEEINLLDNEVKLVCTLSPKRTAWEKGAQGMIKSSSAGYPNH